MPDNALANFIETENIAYFSKLLKTEAHPDKRRILIQLLAEEEAKHAARIHLQAPETPARLPRMVRGH
jgi:hypothetical protein